MTTSIYLFIYLSCFKVFHIISLYSHFLCLVNSFITTELVSIFFYSSCSFVGWEFFCWHDMSVSIYSRYFLMPPAIVVLQYRRISVRFNKISANILRCTEDEFRKCTAHAYAIWFMQWAWTKFHCNLISHKDSKNNRYLPLIYLIITIPGKPNSRIIAGYLRSGRPIYMNYLPLRVMG